MERTELREQFFAEVRTDPYTHMLFKSFVRAWAFGYDQALRDHGLTDARLSKSFSDREDDAVEFLTSEKKKAEAQWLIAMAQVASLMPSASFQDRAPVERDPAKNPLRKPGRSSECGHDGWQVGCPVCEREERDALRAMGERSSHRGSCRIHYAEAVCTCGEVNHRGEGQAEQGDSAGQAPAGEQEEQDA